MCDDEVMNRKVATKILKKEGYDVMEAQNGQEALELLKQHKFDLILMDLMMPVLDGFEATRIIKENEETASIPLIVISALSERSSITKALQLGADEYITKPFDIVEFTLRVRNGIKLGSVTNMLKEEVAKKTRQLQEALEKVQKSEEEVIAILGKTAEFRDHETSAHTMRVGEMAALLAKKYGKDEEYVELIRLAAPMHDIGKIGIADVLLLKPGKLDLDEFEVMKTHAEIGYKILSTKKTPLLQMAAQIAYTHHEKYNGLGYPRGLKGDEIPLCGAITAIVDVFDALMAKRPYKEPFSLEQALQIIEYGKGEHFNPVLTDLFIENIDEIMEIREQLGNV